MTNLGTGLAVSVATNDSGFYAARELLVGQYRISVEAQGFSTISKTGLTLNAGSIARVDFALQVGTRSESVEVAGGATPVETQTARLYETVGAAQIANLPLNGRNVYDLIQQAPGAVKTLSAIYEGGANATVNGVRVNFNGFLINGVSNKGLIGGGPVTQPIQDTVQEFQLVTLNIAAEFGNSAGSVTNLVTKSGTNSYHGSAWWFVRNDIFDANAFFLNKIGEEKPPLRFNQFGTVFGGPIIKNKLFFFGAYQGTRFVTSSPPFTRPRESAEFRQAVVSAFPGSVAALLYNDFSANTPPLNVYSFNDYLGLGVSGSGFVSAAEYLCPDPGFSTPAIAAQFATLIGVTAQDQTEMADFCSVVPALQAGTFSRDLPFFMDTLVVVKAQNEILLGNLFQGNEASLRLDYNFSANDRAFAQFNWERRTDVFGIAAPWVQARGFNLPNRRTAPNAQISWVHTFTPNLINEARFGYAGGYSSGQADHPGVPFIGFADQSIGFGAYSGYPNFFKEHIYTYSDLVSFSKGKHTIKAGIDLRRNIENSDWHVERPSYYFFDPLFFAADAPYFEALGVDPGILSNSPPVPTSSVRHFRNLELGAFFHDDWKISKRLTLNLGLRYDLFTRHSELNDLETQFLFGPGNSFVDDLATGAGQVQAANAPAGTPGCDTPMQFRLAQIAGICGPGGFAPDHRVGAGDHNNFGPRVGFAWDMFGNGKMSLRGGFGVSYEGTLYNMISNTRWNLPFYSVNAAVNALGFGSESIFYGPQTPGQAPSYTGPADPANNAGPGAVGNLGGWDPANPNIGALATIIPKENFRDPYVLNWFLGIQREIAAGLTLEVNYVGTGGRKLFQPRDVNLPPGGRLPEGACVVDNLQRTLCSRVNSSNPLGRMNPNYDSLRMFVNAVSSSYHALQLSVRKRMSRGFQLHSAYTWSHSIDAGSVWHPGTSGNNGAAGDGFPTDFLRPELDRGNSIFDVRQRLTFNYVWGLPWFKTGNPWLRHTLGGWQLNGLWSFQSGLHWGPRGSGTNPRLLALAPGACTPNAQGFITDTTNCVVRGTDFNLNGQGNDRPNALTNHPSITREQWANGWNMPDFFSNPCLGCVGNLGRNNFVGPGFWAADISLFKKFEFSERVALQFRAEAFNVFNRANFQLPGAYFSGNNFLNSPQFGRAGGTFNPRNLQFGLKLSF